MITNRSMPPAVIIPELPYLTRAGQLTGSAAHSGLLRLWIVNYLVHLSFGEGSLVVTQRNHGANASFSVMVRVNEIDIQYIRVKQTGAQIVARQKITPTANANTPCRTPVVTAGRSPKALQTLIQKPGVVYFSKIDFFSGKSLCF